MSQRPQRPAARSPYVDWLRAELITRLKSAIAAHRLSPQEAAVLCGIGRAELSMLLDGHGQLTVEQLLAALTCVGVEVEIRFVLGDHALGPTLALSGGAPRDS